MMTAHYLLGGDRYFDKKLSYRRRLLGGTLHRTRQIIGNDTIR